MRIIQVATLLLVFAVSANAQDFSTPKKTFKYLLKCIEKEDIENYKKCWSERALEREGMYSKLKNNPKKWSELHDIFTGPQKMTNLQWNDEKTRLKASVKAPKAKHGGIGAIGMVKEEGEWKMRNW